MSIIREIDKGDHNSAEKVSLLFSAKSRDELIFRRDIEDICERRPDTFTARYFVTGGEARDDDDTRRAFGKRIDSDDLSSALGGGGDMSSVFCYICGPNPMTKDCAAALIQLGVPKDNVFYELWW